MCFYKKRAQKHELTTVADPHEKLPQHMTPNRIGWKTATMPKHHIPVAFHGRPIGVRQEARFVVKISAGDHRKAFTNHGAIKASVEKCKQNGAFDPSTMGTVPNVGLMAQKAEESATEANGALRNFHHFLKHFCLVFLQGLSVEHLRLERWKL